MLHTIGNALLTVTVSEMGAELQSILGADGTEYLWQGDPAFWAGRSPVLFPFVGRLNGQSYRMDGKHYEIGIHGFARTSRFSLEEKTEDRLVFLLTDNETTYTQYPRRFALRVIYTLREDTLQMLCRVENRDDRVMYFGIGGHPGFRVPLVEGIPFEDYRLRFAEKGTPDRQILSPSYLLSGKTEPYPLENGEILSLRHELFDDDAVVLSNVCRQVTLETPGDCHGVTVSYPDMPHLGLWHKPMAEAPYVCIEPWYTLPAVQDEVTVLEERKDMISLKPGQLYENAMTIRCF